MARVVLHIDMNSYFATVEQQSNPLLRGKPIVVSGRPHIHSVVAAASVEAKKFGVKSGMSTWEAKKLCPQVIFIPGNPNKYMALTGKLIEIFRSYSPLVEVFSIDEVFLELLPPHQSMEDAVEIAKEIKLRIKEEVGDFLTCSIGIAHNKLLAKLASEKQKPDGLTVIDDNNLHSMLLSSPLRDFCGIGRQVLKRLQMLGVNSVAQLRLVPDSLLKTTFGPSRASFLKQLAWGIDISPVISEEEREDAKSFSHNLTLPKETSDWKYIEAVLLRLSEKVAYRMRQDGFCAKVISAHLRYTDLSWTGGQKLLGHYSDSGEEIFQIVKSLMRKDPGVEIRAVGVGASYLRKKSLLTAPLLPEDQKKEKITDCLDKVNNEFGRTTLFRAAVLPAFERDKQVAGIRTRLRFN